MLTPYTKINSVPFQGGCITRHHKSLLAFGQFSMAQNVRPKHPGFKKRPGQIVLHTTPDRIALTNNITAITKSTSGNPGVVSSTAHSLAVGDRVYFTGLNEMTELNGTTQTVTVIDSAGLELLCRHHREMGAQGLNLKLCGSNEVTQKILELTRLSRRFEILPDTTAAVRSYL